MHGAELPGNGKVSRGVETADELARNDTNCTKWNGPAKFGVEKKWSISVQQSSETE